MKTLIMLFLISSFSFAVFSEIPNSCKEDMDSVIENYHHVMSLEEEVTADEKEYLLSVNQSSAEIVALSCKGLEMLRIQRTFWGSLGFISSKKAEAKADKVSQEVLRYYYNQTREL